MLPDKKYTPEDLIAVAQRRFWFVLVPLAVVSAVTAVVARGLPDTYKSQALLAVVPQQVPENFVRPTVTTTLDDRLTAIQDRVLSRPRLEKLIQDLNLYPEQRRTGFMDDIVQRMKTRDLKFERASPVSFRVSFVGSEPASTKKVVDYVASAIIDESLIDRTRATDLTSTFLEGELEAVHLRLIEKEQAVTAYRRQHSHELPTQVESNLRSMEGVLGQAQSNVMAVNTARQNKILLERELANLMEAPTAGGALPAASALATAGRAAAPVGAAQELEKAQRDLEAASARHTAAHPDVQRLTGEVQRLAAKAAAEANATPAARGLPPGASPAEIFRANRIEELASQLKELDSQIAQHAAEEKRLREAATVYQARAEAGPNRDAELTELMRDYTQLQGQYSGLLGQTEAAKRAANLQRREMGEQFRVVEPATLPLQPSSPNRPQITLFGMLAGIGIGVALIALLEYRDSGFKTDDQVTAVLGLPVLAVVPIMQSEPDRRRALVRKLVIHVGLGSAVAGCLAVLAYTFVR